MPFDWCLVEPRLPLGLLLVHHKIAVGRCPETNSLPHRVPTTRGRSSQSQSKECGTRSASLGFCVDILVHWSGRQVPIPAEPCQAPLSP